jgi:HSP20 family protein
MSNVLAPVPSRSFERFNQMIEDLFVAEEATGALVSGKLLPPVDVFETLTEYKLLLDLPGCDQNDIDVELRGEILIVSGKREKRYEAKRDGSMIRHERRFGCFVRSFALQTPVKPEAMTAHFDNGVLTVIAPKVKMPEPTKIPVKTHQVHN